MRIFIMGAGRMGAWLAELLGASHEVVVYDRDKEKLKSLVKAKGLSELRAVKDVEPSLLINAVSLPHTREAFEEAIPHLPEGCLLSDIASLKEGLHGLYVSMGRRFVSTHPMFGPTFADMTKLQGENAILIKESDEGGMAFFRSLYEGLGIRVFEYTFEEHDVAMARSLSVPFASSMAFAACIKDGAAPGTSFKKHLHIARDLLTEDHRLLSEILFSPHTVRQIEGISAQLTYLCHIVRCRDHEELEKFLSRLKKNVDKALCRV